LQDHRFTFHPNADGTASVFDHHADQLLAGPVPTMRAVRVYDAANAADAKLDMIAGTSAVHVLGDVSVRVTADSSLWATHECLFCGCKPCEFSDVRCVEIGEVFGEEGDGPLVTVALPVEVAQALLGPAILQGHLDALRGHDGNGPQVAVYAVDTDVNRDVLTALRALLDWRAEAVEVLALVEDDVRGDDTLSRLLGLLSQVPTP
jgi:hypothetical protein